MMKIIRTKTTVGKNLTVALKQLDGLEGRVGWFKDARYEEYKENGEKKGGEYVAFIAAQNEYGNPNKNIPARPFMRPTIREQKNKWLAFAAKLSGQVLEGKLYAHQAMESIAVMAENDVLKKIASIYTPPLAPITIEKRIARYSNQNKLGNLYKPLVDTGHMIATLTHEVVSA
jgi:hypothetical protein